MSGTYVTPPADLDDQIARLDEGAARIMKFHSGSRPMTLLKALEDHYSRNPGVPVIQIHRRPSCRGRQGAMNTVRCGLCAQSGRFQKIAGHIVNEHFKLSLWYCDVCATSVSRKSDLARHQYIVHNISRPREANAERRSQFSSPVAAPTSPTTLSLSPGPEPTRNSRTGGRSRELSHPSPYPAISTFTAASPREDFSNWRNDNDLLTNSQPHSSPMTRGDGGRLGFDPQVHPGVVLRETAPPTNRVLSFPDDHPRLPYATYPGSSSGFGTWHTSSDAIDLSQQGAAYPSLPSAPGRRAEQAHSFDHHHSSTFLSSVSCTPAASSLWTDPSPFPTLVHRKTAQMQPETAHPGMYAASNSTQAHFPSSASNLHHSSITQSSQYLMTSNSITSSQDNRPTRAQIDMTPAVPRGSLPTGQWGSTSSVPPLRRYQHHSVDEEFNSYSGMPGALFSRHSFTQ